MSVSLLVDSPVAFGPTTVPAAPTVRSVPRPARVAPFASTVLVRRVTDPSELSLLYCLRYRAYVDAMRRAAHEVDPGYATIVDAFDDGHAINLGAFSGAELRGALRLNLASRSDLGEHLDRYAIASRRWGLPVSRANVAIGSRFALRPGHESPALALKMGLAAHWECLRNDVLRVFVQVEHHLVGFHLSLGFRKADTDVPDVDGTALMALDPFDAAGLRAAGSPLALQLDAWREHSPIAVARYAAA